MTDIPEWAGERACELLSEESPNFQWRWPDDSNNPNLRTVAKLVMQHETKPTDPDEEAVKRIIAAHLDLEPLAVMWSPNGLSRAVAQYKQERGNG